MMSITRKAIGPFKNLSVSDDAMVTGHTLRMVDILADLYRFKSTKAFERNLGMLPVFKNGDGAYLNPVIAIAILKPESP